MGDAGRSRWQAARVVAIEPRTPTITSFFFALPGRPRFIPGQHYDVRLVAEDGYEAQRSYSIASAPDSPGPLELAIERLAGGEVSPFFHDVVAVGDEIELRGPIGGHFAWSVADGGPLLLVGGGSGVVPLVSMARHNAASARPVRAALVASARTGADLPFDAELRRLGGAGRFDYFATVTREAVSGRDLRPGRIDAPLLAEALEAIGERPRHVFVCGTNGFVEHVAQRLIDLGIAGETIRTERYGG